MPALRAISHLHQIRTEHLGREGKSGDLQAALEDRPDAGRHQIPDHVAFLVDAGLVEPEDLAHDHVVAFHPHHLGNRGDPPGPVSQARLLKDQVHSGGDLFTDNSKRKIEAGKQGEGFETRDRVSRRVGMEGGQRPIVASVHGLEHVQGFPASHLADDNSVGTHAERISDEMPDSDFSLPRWVGRFALEPDDVLRVQLELGGIFNGDDPFRLRNELGKDVQ